MRNFEERMAEIKQRSHTRITRRRKQLTALCLPLVAALCISGALLIGLYENVYTIRDQSTVRQGSRLTVQLEEESKIYTNASRVEKTCLLLGSLRASEDTHIGFTQTTSYSADTAAQIIGCTFILEAGDGTEQTYKLQGSVLTNQATHEVYTLTQEQYKELLKLLGLPTK